VDDGEFRGGKPPPSHNLSLAGVTSVAKRISPRANEGAESCQFCRISRGELNAAIVFEDAISIAFLDHRPLFPGHCLLVTKQHYKTLLDLPAEIVGALFLNVQRLAAIVQRVMGADGTFVAINNVVSQSVPHFHVHIVPRRRGDGLRGFFWPRHKVGDEELGTVQKNLREAIGERPGT
jgi:histidine triad (HIT) family protein